MYNSRRTGRHKVKPKIGSDWHAMPCITDAMFRKAEDRKQEFYTAFDLYTIISPYYHTVLIGTESSYSNFDKNSHTNPTKI